MARLFVALVPPPLVQAELTTLAVPLAGARSTPPENIHLTLRFVGETDADKQARYSAALARVRVEPFVLPVGGVGQFPARGHVKVLWAGVGHGHPRLHQLRKEVDEALLAVDPALAVSSFHPHFTIGRLGETTEPKELNQFLERYARFEAPPFRVADFHLLASELPPGRAPLYRTVQVFPLQP